MYTPTQLDIIQMFGKKELTEGCIITGLCLDKYGELKERRLCMKTYSGYFLVNSKRGNFNEHCSIVSKPSSIELLGHIPELFPNVAIELLKNGYVLELLKIDTIKSVLKISRFDIKKDLIIPYKKTLPLLEQPESTLLELLTLFK